MDDDGVVEMPEPPRSRRPPPSARCDVCHERGSRVRRTRDELLAVCSACARGVDVSAGDSTEAIAALTRRAPAGQRRVLTRRLLARRSMHLARRERRVRPSRESEAASSTASVVHTLDPTSDAATSSSSSPAPSTPP
jgi:hypothetical protein